MPAAAEAHTPRTGGSSRFAYRGRRADGTLIRGVLEAPNHGAAVKQLKKDGLSVIACDLAPMDAAVGQTREPSVRALSMRFRRDDVIALCQQLSVMLRTGVPLAEALETFAAQARNKHVGTVVRKIRDGISEGEDFSTALSRWPSIFPPLVVSLVRAAEASGLLAEMLGRVAKELAKQRKTAKQVKGAMVYPGIMLVVAIGAVTIILTWVLPKFRPLFVAQGDRLPAATKVLMGFSDFLSNQWYWYLPALVVGIAGLLAFAASPPGRALIDRLKLETPVIGKMIRHLYVARLTSTMATLLGAGVALLDVTKICRAVNPNARFNALWDSLEERVQHGKEMSAAFSESPYISRHISAIIHAGEKSGRLPEVLEQTAAYAEEELDVAIKATTSLVEPVLIVGMGVVVGGIAAAMLLPIFNMSKMVR